ncbi:MAG: hypothetical protein NC187_09860 [Candidatus Amulumruptor caecigallinarius]|nr:hypothetical protein [Candidatus Amulumruptor caecigallinarius]MCM1397770.1 hypothetical protein [Candidatus Amulumruptor caecigallinarius]MCM1454810.1 hypothetical protein [bacterium]
MKKLLLLATAALMTLGASADWYLVGDKYGWSDNAAYKFSPTDNANEYSLKVAELSGQIKIKEGGSSWNSAFATSGTTKLKEGVVFQAQDNSNNISNITVDGTITDATITINTANYTILAVGAAKENEYSEVYLVGNFGDDWTLERTDYPLTLKAGSSTVYEGSYELKAGITYFKMRAGTLVYGTGKSGDTAVKLGTKYTASQSGDSFTLNAGKYNFSFTLEKNADTGVLEVTADGPVTYPEKMYIFGQVNGLGWAPNNYVEMTTTDEGVYKVEDVLIGNAGEGLGYFSFATGYSSLADESEWTNVGTRYGATANNTPVEVGKPMEISGGENSFSITCDHEYTMTLSLKDMTLTVEGYEPPVLEDAKFGLVGSINDWDITSPIDMTQTEGNVFTYSVAELEEGAEFKIAKLGTYANTDAAWAATLGAEGPEGDSTAPPVDVTVGTDMNAWPGSSNNFRIAAKLTDVTITFFYDDTPNAASILLVEGTVAEDPEPEPVEPAQSVEAMFDFTSIPADFTEDDYQTDSSAKTNSFIDVTNHVFNVDGVTLTATGGNTSPRFYKTVASTTGAVTCDLRIYKTDGNITLKAPENYYIESVTLNSTAAKSTSNVASMTYGSDFEANSAYTTPTGMKASLQVVAKSGTKPSDITLTTASGKNTRISTIEVVAQPLGTAIENIAGDFDANAPVEYYNLQGIRVANPAAGIYIMRQGSKAAKVMLH